MSFASVAWQPQGSIATCIACTHHVPPPPFCLLYKQLTINKLHDLYYNLGVACGPGFTLQILAPASAQRPGRAVGFPLQSLTLACAQYQRLHKTAKAIT